MLLIVLLAAATAVAPPDSAPSPDSASAKAPATRLRWSLRPVAVLVARGDGRGQALEPSGLAVDAFGRVVVADAALNRLQRFERDGRWLGETGSLGSGPGALRRPGSVAMLGALTVAALDYENRRIEHYDQFGRPLGTPIGLTDPALIHQVG